MRRSLWSIWILAGLAMACAACGKKTSDTAAEQAIESSMRASGQEADVSVDSGTMRVSTKDGDMSFGEGTKLPEQWPKDVPVYKGLKLASAMTAKEGSTIQGTTADGFDTVTAFYKEQLKKEGWTEATALTQPQMAMLSYTKESRSATVTISAQDAETMVSISVNNP